MTILISHTVSLGTMTAGSGFSLHYKTTHNVTVFVLSPTVRHHKSGQVPEKSTVFGVSSCRGAKMSIVRTVCEWRQ